MSDGAGRVLVVGPSWVGDMVISQALYIFLEQTRPGVVVDVLAPPWSLPVLERMPQVRRALAQPIGHGELALGERLRLGRQLRGERYDQAILLPNSFKSALIPRFARIPLRTGWRGEWRYGLLNDLRELDKGALPLMAQRFVALGQERGEPLPRDLPAPRLEVDPARAGACRDRFALDRQRPILALCPGAEFGGAKRWPAPYFAELARHYLGRGWQVVLYGSENDRVVTAEIAAGTGGACLDLASRTTLAEAVDLLSLSSAVVSNDSGLMHIAAALSRPLVAIYGATSPAFTPPLDDNSVVLASEVDCAPCFRRECPLGHHRCMREIPVAEVAAKLDALR